MTNDKITLWGITEEMEAMDDLLEMDQGEITPELEELQQHAQSILELKVDSCVGYIEREENNIKAAKEKIEEFKKYIKTKENKISAFENFVRVCIEKTGKTSFQGEFKEIKLRKASKKLLINDEKLIPIGYMSVIKTTKIDTAQIKKDLKSGSVEGCELIDGTPGVMMGLKKGGK